MKTIFYQDETVNLNLDEIIANLGRIAPAIQFLKGESRFSLPNRIISVPPSYHQIGTVIKRETVDSDHVLLFTEKPYDNNFFWETPDGKNYIISMSDWDSLTKLSRNNGVVYFTCSILVEDIGVGKSHDENTGCINDFWWDKSGIDIGMQSAFICPRCLGPFEKHATARQKNILGQIQLVLNDLSAASRKSMDICDYWEPRNQDEMFDVFLCHNSKDKDAVREIGNRLKKKKIKTWLDEEQLPPGRPWQELLEKQMAQIKTATVFVGKSGIGPWQDMEIRSFLTEFVNRKCPVIPVILPDCRDVPELPLFLRQFTWVDLRKKRPDPFKRLVWGITGRKP